ncbi:hypothetical protein OsI_39205 [Oryza sativa Indica Group]|uniref:Uncharacterized protein n=1 Tax=Oryza sativa subsp. indica TaxID=39946 RepID=A2ZMZ6_ORYSI|nr:hypothetical protein OsI_39205 [Oryza sativa Indica Group]
MADGEDLFVGDDVVVHAAVAPPPAIGDDDDDYGMLNYRPADCDDGDGNGGGFAVYEPMIIVFTVVVYLAVWLYGLSKLLPYVRARLHLLRLPDYYCIYAHLFWTGLIGLIISPRD